MAFEGLNYPCWELLDCQGEVPQSRSGHTCALYNNRYLYIFGGFDGSSCFDDLYVLDLETRLWRRIEAGGDRPSGRASHSAVTDQLAGVMYIFGGSGSHFGYTNKRDLCEFCFETESWRLLSNPAEDTPSARYGQSMVAYQQGLYVWGGTHGTNYPTDMYRFDLCTKQWEYLITSGDCPCGRYRHQAMVKDDLMYIVGGSGINRYGDVWTFHFGTNVWRRVNCSGTDLSDGRYAHSAVLREGFIYLYGGNDTVRHDDLLQLDLETKIWSRVLVHGKDCPPGRDFHAAVLRKDSMVVFGGSNGMRRHNDVFEFHMAPKIPPCSLSSDLEATFEAAQTQDVIQRSCNIFLAANDSDWVHGVFCHEHLIQVRCPHLYRLVQDRVNGAASGSDTAEQDDNLDSLLRAVKDDNVKAVPGHAPPGWMASECSSHCHWIPVDLPHIILHHFLLFLYSDSTRFGHLSMDQLYRLFLTAKQWEVPRLAALCERQIKIRLSIDSVLPLLRISAAEPRAESIQDACKQFFLANYQACTNLQECEALDPRLLCELMRLNTAKAASPMATAAPGPPMAPSATSPSSPQVIHSSGSAPQLATSPGARSKAGQSPQACEESSWPATLDHAQALPPSTLAQDLKRLLTEELAPDFEVVVQDEVILVHKFLMVARSKYFETCILTSGMQESQEGRLVIDASWAMTAEEFRALLHFLYAGDEILRILAPHTAMYLVDASSFYGLTNHRLKHFCELCIKDSFNETHVLQLFEASSRLDVEGTQAVRSMALDFIISNFHTVCQQPALEQLDRSLLIEIMRGVADRLHPSPPHVQTVQLT